MTGCRALNHPGARRVGALDDAGRVERLIVWSIRRGLDGPAGRQAVWNWFAAETDRARAAELAGLLEAHLGAIATHARRKIYRHRTACACLGADEARLGDIVAAASVGDLPRAYAAAAVLIRTEGLFEVVETAAQLGRMLFALDVGPPDDDALDAFSMSDPFDVEPTALAGLGRPAPEN